MSLFGKRILIVGAGFGQIPAIIKAKENGAIVYAVDKNPDADGSKYAHKFFQIDVKDEDSILNLVKKEKIEFAFTMQSDHGIKSVARVNQFLEIDAFSYHTAILCSNKIEFRNCLRKFDISQPKFRVVYDYEECLKATEEFGYPSMIKCPDSSGSRGISKVGNSEEVYLAFNEALAYSSIKNGVIVEEYIEGFEFGAQTLSKDGKCSLVLIHDDEMYNESNLVPIGHSFPFKNNHDINLSAAKETIKKAVESIGIINGPANVDVIYDVNSRQIKIIEIGARIGATCLPELTSIHTGIDWVVYSMLLLVEDINLDQIKLETNPCVARILFSNQTGTVRSINIDNPGILNNVTEFELTIKVGDRVHKLSKGTDRIGKIVLVGENLEMLEKISSNFLSNFNLEIE